MIIMGYPGIGKSYLANKENNYIDLDSSLFYNGNKKVADWYKIYCNIAANLSSQNFNVFISCHKEVQEELIRRNEFVCVVYPALCLKEDWIKRLEDRYEASNSGERSIITADYNAFKRARDHYDEDIESLSHNKRFHQIPIWHITYSLKDILEKELEDEKISEIKSMKAYQFLFDEKGKKFLDKKYHEIWSNLIYNNYLMYNKDELSAAIAVAYNLDHNGSFESAEEILNKRYLNKSSLQMFDSLIDNICDRGKEFSKYLYDKGVL